MKNVGLLVIIGVVTFGFTQPPDTIWTRTHGGAADDVGNSIKQTPDGGYIITGYESYPPVYGRMFLSKTDAAGDTVWSKRFFLGYSPHGRCVCEISDVGYVVAGDAWSAMPRNFCLLVRTDAKGDILWSKSYGPDYTNSRLTSVMQTGDSGFVACGFKGPTWRSKALWIVQTDSQGDSVGANEYGDSLTERSGNSMRLTNDSGYTITGTCLEQVNYDLFLFKTNETGDSLWCVSCGGAAPDSGNEVQQTDDGGYIVVGCTESCGAGGSDVWLLKFEPEVAVEENKHITVEKQQCITTIFSGPLVLPEDKTYKVFDITGRFVMPDKIKPGIYFIEIDGKIEEKIVKIR